MILYICLCSATFVLVSANNVIPVQTYPIYQQNGFLNQPSNQPINVQPYTSSITSQNQLQQLNISPSSIKQAILNKLLTGSSTQANLNPNTQNYGMNLYNVPNNQIPGNFVSNNLVLPAGYYNDMSNSNNDNISRYSKGRVRSTQTNNKKPKSKRSQNNVKEIEDNSRKRIAKETNKTQKRGNRKNNVQVPKQTRNLENKENGNKNSNKVIKNSSRRRKEQTIENPVDKNNEQSPKARRRKKKQKRNKENINNDELERGLDNKSVKKENENIDLDMTCDGMDVENRKTRNSKQEVNNIYKSYPNTPREITNNFLTNLNQLNNPMMSNWFAHYENLYQSLLNNPPIVVNESRSKRKKKNKNKKNKRKKNIQNRTLSTNGKNDHSNKNTPDYTATGIHLNPTVESFKPFETNDRNMKYTSNEIFQDGYNLSEFEDNYDPEYYGGYIDDYYPLFADSAAYTANNKEVVIKNLNDNKYFYATDLNETNIPRKHHLSGYDFSEYASNDFETFKHTYDEIEKESIRNAYDKNVEKEIRFRSPPFLELPDFKTRQIDKSEIQAAPSFDDKIGRYVGDKSFSAKTANFNGSKKNGIKQQAKDIETIFAQSKVVAYGPAYVPGEHSLSAGRGSPWSERDSTSNSYQNDGTTYVVAKSSTNNEMFK